MLKSILHASDFSPASRPAFTIARVLARKLGARLTLFHAYEGVAPLVMGAPMMPMAGPASGAIVDKLWAMARTAGERGLERLAARARRDGLRVSKRLAAGAPASAIVRAARKERAAMVVLGTHGRTGLPRLLLGSVAERVIRTALCPVVTVPRRRR
jgi:nucleotide-binding universal stress UspA family protein